MKNHAKARSRIMLTLMILAATQVPSTVQAGPLPAEGGGCIDTNEDNWGFAGSTVSCDITCGGLSTVNMKVTTADTTYGVAKVRGKASCEGAIADCPQTPITCVGPAQGAASKVGTGDCNGSSDEFWDSPLTVACVVTPGTTEETPDANVTKLVCEAYPDFPGCKPETDPTPCPSSVFISEVTVCERPVLLPFVKMVADCIASQRQLLELPPHTLDALFPASFNALPVESYIGATRLADLSLLTVSYSADAAKIETIGEPTSGCAVFVTAR